MGGESVGSCPPNVFSLADRANTVVEPGVSLVLKLKLCMLMLLFKEFSDFAHRKSARIELSHQQQMHERCAYVTPCMA